MYSRSVSGPIILAMVLIAMILAPVAALAAHGRPGLWTVSSTMQMANMPQMPPEAMAMMKAHGMKMQGMGGQPVVTQICMTQEEVDADKPPAMNNRDESCTNKILSQTPTSITAETVCHGRMDGVGHMQINWHGNEHYQGSYSFKGTAQGHPQEFSTDYSGDFVKADCGSVKPYVMAH
jgi:hypothetical protein